MHGILMLNVGINEEEEDMMMNYKITFKCSSQTKQTKSMFDNNKLNNIVLHYLL